MQPTAWMSPCDYDLNPKLKESMCGTRFGDIQELMSRLTQENRRVNKEALLDDIQKLPTLVMLKILILIDSYR